MTKFYNAGAGSGKTHTLSEQLAVFLESHEPSQVILTTFTIKAADELKERVRRFLLKRGMPLKAAEMDNAVIGTVNSVCSRLVEKYSMEIGIGTELRVLDEMSTKHFFNEFVNVAVSRETSKELGKLCNVFSYFERKEGSNQSDSLKPGWPQRVKDLANRFRAYNFSESDVEKSKQEAVNAAKTFLLTRSDLSLSALWDCIDNEQNLLLQEPFAAKDKKAIDALENLRQLLSTRQASYTVFAKAGNDIAVKTSKNNPWFTAHIVRCKEYHCTVEFRDHYIRFINLVYETAFVLINEYQAFKSERGLIDFADQELLFLQMLQTNAVVRNEITATFKMVMVDEFQDSSPVQLAIFDELKKLVEHAVWVGDPKQAIYGFRDSDTELFQKALDNAREKGAEINPLPNSYRSRPALVYAANEIFNGIFENFLEPKHISLQPCEDTIAREGIFDSPALRVQFYADSNQENYYRSLARQVKQFLDSEMKVYDKSANTFRAIRGGDIALLFRQNDHIRKAAEAFKEISLPVSCEADGLQHQAEVLWMAGLLRLLINPHDSLAIANIALLEQAIETVQALIEKRIPFADAEKEAFENQTAQTGDQWQTISPIVQVVAGQQKLLAQMPLVQAINHLVTISQLAGYCARWGNSDQRMANIGNVVAQAAAYQQQCEVTGMAATFAGYLDHLCQLETLPPSESEHAVTLITGHKSKGLEWNMVIPVNLSMGDDDYKVIFNTIHVRHPAEQHEHLLGGQTIYFLPWPFGDSKKISSAVPDLIDNRNALDDHLQATNRFYREEDRLMYVALTRARDFLVLPFYKKDSGCGVERDRLGTETGLFTAADWETLKKKVHGDVVDLKGHNIIVEHVPVFAEPEEQELLAGQEVYYYNIGEKDLEHQPAPRYIWPSRQKVYTKGITVKVLNDYQQSRLPLNGLKANEVTMLGIALHHAFAGWKYDDSKDMRQRSLQLLLDRMQLNGHVQAKELDDRFTSFRNYIYTKYAPLGEARELPLRNVMGGNGTVTSGTADMVLQTKEGLVLIDHKTFPGDFESMALNEGHEHYAGKYGGQLLSYKQMLEASTGLRVVGMLLHYVVQGRVVEVCS